MSKKSETGNIVTRNAGEIPPPTRGELARMRADAAMPIDYSDIPEKTGPFRPVMLDAEGRPPEPLPQLRESPIRLAILAELGRRHMTRYALWQAAQQYCPQLPASAVYEFLRGQREIGLPYAEALLAAVGLGVGPTANKVVTDSSRLGTVPGREKQRAETTKPPSNKAISDPGPRPEDRAKSGLFEPTNPHPQKRVAAASKTVNVRDSNVSVHADKDKRVAEIERTTKPKKDS